MDANDIPESGGQSGLLALDHDILLSIFKINSDMFAIRSGSLKSLRQYSQVCREWRQLVLQSSSLWGQAIDFDELILANVLWKDEVLRRNVDSLMWIKATIDCSLKGENGQLHLTNVYNVLDTQWGRIEKVYLDFRSHPLHIDLGKWSALWSRPAPFLRSFEIASGTTPPHYLMDPIPESQKLFSDHAPALVEFHTNPLLVTPLKSDAPWLRHIRILHLDGLSTLPASIFHVIQAAPLLEEVHIYPYSLSGRESYPRVKLLHAKAIHVHGDIRFVVVVLEHLAVPKSCAVHIILQPQWFISLRDGKDVSDDITRLNLYKSVARSIRGYMDQYLPASLSITVSRQKATISDTNMLRPIVSVTVRPGTNRMYYDANDIFQNIFEEFQFLSGTDSSRHSANQLELKIDTLFSQSSLLVLAPLLSSQTAVETLRIHDKIIFNPEQSYLDNVHSFV